MSILQQIKSKWLHWRIEQHQAIRITFTGGLGAQILSTAIYYYFIERGFNTLADFSYFDNTHLIATPGEKGQISFWKWEMDSYGIGRNRFAVADGKFVPTLRDGALKFSLSLQALSLPTVRARFDVARSDKHSVAYRNTELQNQPYLCLHVRRGDYLNVASHLVSMSNLKSIASEFAGLIDRILILSDSPVNINDFPDLRSMFRGGVHIIDNNPDPVLAHSLMRNAKVLVCSNSQFSLSAGLLSDGLVVLPKTWYGGGARDLNTIVASASDFSVLRKIEK